MKLTSKLLILSMLLLNLSVLFSNSSSVLFANKAMADHQPYGIGHGEDNTYVPGDVSDAEEALEEALLEQDIERANEYISDFVTTSCTDSGIADLRNQYLGEQSSLDYIERLCDGTLNNNSYNDCNEESSILLKEDICNGVREIVGVESNSLDDGLETNSCYSIANPLTWIICPMISVLNSLMENLDDFLTDNLDSPTDLSEYRSALESIRTIALVLLSGAFIIVTVMYGISPGNSSYSLKRSLPRIGIASIFIILAPEITTLTIDFFNILGQSVVPVLESIGSEGYQAEKDNITLGNAFGKLNNFDQVITSLILLTSYGALLAAAVGGYVVTVLVVVLREIAIILLAIISPLAFAAMVLPNTQQYFSKWWKQFIALGLMYPIIISIFTIAKLVFYLWAEGK